VDLTSANKTDANFDFTTVTMGTIGGKVTDNTAGANIGVYAFETATFALTQVTAVNGDYSFTLSPGKYEIFVIKTNGKIFYYKDGGATQSEAEATILTVAGGGQLSDKNLDITEDNNVLTGKVTFKRADGDPAINVLITATSAAGKGIAITGQNGAYSIGGLKPGNYLVEMNPLNSKYAVQSATVTIPTTSPQDFIIDTGNVLTGTITNSSGGAAVPGAMVYLLDQQTGGLINGRMYFSDALGKYTIADIANGIVTLNVTHPLYRNYSEPNLSITSDLTKDVQLVRGAYFNITVRDGDNGNVALPGALVIVLRAGAVPVYALTDASGNCKIYGLDSSKSDYIVIAQKAGFERKAPTGLNPVDGGTPVTIDLIRPAARFALSGTITSDCPGNPPVIDAFILVSSAAKDFFASTVTDTKGEYGFTDLPQASDYRLVVVPGGALRTQVQTGLNYTGSLTQTNSVTIPCGSQITGTVTRTGTTPIYVFLYTAAGQFVGFTQADGTTGAYTFTGIAAGNYKVLAVSSGFSPKWYDGKSDINTANAVNAGGTANIALAP
jgi:hypothetical protein